MLSTANHLEKERANSRNLDEELDNKESRIEQLKTEKEELAKKLKDIQNSTASTADRARQMEQMLEYEQRNEKSLMVDIQRMQGILFRTQQALVVQKEITRSKEIDIGGCETAIGFMHKQGRNLETEVQKQNEVIYDLVSRN